MVDLKRSLLSLVVVAGACMSGACSVHVTPDAGHPVSIRESLTTATIHGKRLDVHLGVPDMPLRRDVLVVYASGDGGWFGSAIDQWRQIARDGYITAGFSARAFLRIDRPAGAALNRERLAGEYHLIVDAARQAMAAPPPAPQLILAGWSRGAAFAALVGAEPSFRNQVSGVLAIGLAEGEDLTIDGDGDDTDDGNAVPGARSWPFDTYAQLRSVPAPAAVIQATHDNYFPAADARQRFGPDTARHRFYAVEARNHRFAGGAAAFATALRDALAWIAQTPIERSAFAETAAP
jgi:hypothetical protein